MKNIVRKMMGLAALAVLTLGGVTEVKGETYQNVTFNDGVRYSQWTINSRIRDFRGNTKRMGFNTYNSAGELQGSDISSGYWWNNDTGSKTRNFTIDYVAGLVAKAIIENVDYNKEKTWAKPWYFSVQNYANQITAPNTGGSQDNMNAVKMYFALNSLASGAYSSLANAGTTTTKASTAFTRTATAFGDLNSNYAIGGPNSNSYYRLTEAAGGWFHKAEYKDQMWCDGLYMGSALLAQLINQTGVTTNISGSTDDWEIIYNQIRISWSQLYDSSKGLLYHAFTASPQNKMWSGVTETGETFHSAAFWGRACGWYMLALVDILEQMKIAGLNESSHPQYSYYTTLKGYLNSLAEGIKNYQDNDTKCWYQVLDEKDKALSGNYIEASCSAIFTAAYFKGIRLGLYDKDYSSVAENAYRACVAQFLRTKEDGTLELINSCASAGLNSPSKTGRDGSRSYYISGSDVTKITDYTEGKIFGAFILAATEYERAYQASKAILFSTDLKASYDLQSGDGITIEACGADGADITYQWYKDGEPVEDATSATIKPDASGAYYCKATSGTTTIQSSTANVTVSGETPAETTYTVTFNATTNGGSCATASLTQASSGASITLPTATKSGYTFNGWYTASTGGTLRGAANASYTPTANETLYAQFTENSGTEGATESITWSGSSLIGGSGTNVAAGTATAVDGSTYKAGTISSSGSKIETESKKHTNDSYWEDFSNGTQSASSTNATSTARIEFPITVADGYTFNVSEVDFNLEQGGGDGPAVHVFLVQGSTSTWLGYTTAATIAWNNLNIDLEAGSAKLVFVLGVNKNLNNGRAFKFSNIAIKGTSDQTGGSTPTPTTYTVSYNMNGHGTAIAAVEGVTALPSTLPTPEATGYIFGGWYIDSGLSTAATAGASISDNTTLYAKWTEKAAATVSISPTSGNVTVGSTLDISSYVTVGSSTGAISYSTGDASKATVTNAGVITGVAEGETTIIVAQAETEEYSAGSATFTITVNAVPVTNYTVTFYNGSQYAIQTIEKGKTVTAPAISPTKQGYTFKGWALENGSTARVLFPYEVWSDVNFYAVWSEDTGGGSGEDEEIFSATATAGLNVPAYTTSGMEITSDNATIKGGKLYVYNGQDSGKNLITNEKGSTYAFLMTNSDTFFKVSLDKALAVGDKIKADIYGPKIKDEEQPRGLWLTTASSRPKSAPTATLSVTNTSTSSDAWMASSDYIVTTDDGICGETTFYIYRATGNSTYFTNFIITREGQVIGDDITLDAATDYENFDDYVGEGKNVTLRRNFTEGKWTTLVLPFSVTTAQLVAAFDHADDCELAKIKSMSVAQGKGSIHYTTVSSIEANEPVLAKIKPNESGKYVFNGVTVVAPTSVVSTSTDGKVEMHGVYKTTSYTKISEDAYFLSGGKFYDWSYLSNMSPFSAYLLPVGENKPSSLSISMEETGIENVNANGNVNANENESYNLAGQRVTKEYNGIVIIKGKKVLKR